MRNVCLIFAASLFPNSGAIFAGHPHSSDETQSCPLKGKKIREVKTVELKGQLVCMACDLKKEKECRKVFQSADDAELLYKVCPKTDLVALEKASVNGPLTVRGTLTSAEDENAILLIETWESAEPGA